MPDSLVLCRGPRKSCVRLVVCDSALMVELDHGWVWDALKAPIWRSDFETKDPQRNFWTIRCVKNQKQGGMPHIFLNRVWTILESTLEEQLQAWQIHICLQNLGSASWIPPNMDETLSVDVINRGQCPVMRFNIVVFGLRPFPAPCRLASTPQSVVDVCCLPLSRPTSNKRSLWWNQDWGSWCMAEVES